MHKNHLIFDKENYNIDTKHKLQELSQYLSNLIEKGIIIAFSGGTDSAMLLWAAKMVKENIGGNLLAVTQDSYSLPRKDLQEAKNYTKLLNIKHEIVQGKEFEDPNYIKNDLNRCYYCRKELFKITDSIIARDGYKYVLYGYNASDKSDFRPGHKAAVENNVLAPLAEIGFTKKEIRDVLRNNNIKLADKPATPCLSSRVMTGIPIEQKHLKNIEAMENVLWNAKAKQFRIRLCKDEQDYFLRIEASENDIPIVLKNKNKLIEMSKEFNYKWITLDLEGYKLGGGVKK
jgi:uncharacterized protein